MKITKLILIALGFITCWLMLFCTSEQRKQREAQFSGLPNTTQWFEVEGKHVHVVVVDSCEYLITHIGSSFGLLTHKGNCKNPFHLKQIMYTKEEKQEIEKAILKARSFGDAKIVRHYGGFIVMAQNESDYKAKTKAIDRGDRNGFYTVERMILQDNQ